MIIKRFIACLLIGLNSVLWAQPAVPDNARLIESVNLQKRLLLIPLKNQTQNSDLDYLSYGIPILIFSNMKTNFLIEAEPLIEKRIQPLAEIENNNQANKIDLQKKSMQTESKNQTILLTATLLDFRSAELREKAKKIPAEFSVIPTKQKELQEKSPADIAIEYNAEWYIFGSIEYEPVEDPVYTDNKGNKIVITKEVRKQFEGKEIPANLQKILAEKKPENLIVKIYLKSFNELNDLFKKEFKLLAHNPYENADFETAASQIEEKLRQKNPFTLRIDSQKQPGFVFLNGAFVGKTPLEIRAPSTPLRLRLEQEGCNIHNQSLLLNQSTSLYIQCNTYQGAAQLQVTSNPADAEVFLDHQKLGVTPLKVGKLPSGVHRVRISKEGYIDSFHGVTLKDNQLATVDTRLTKGDTVEYYTDPGYAIQDWTYEDLSLGLFLQSLMFGGGWAYSNVRANSILDSIRSPWLPAFIPDPSYSWYHYQTIEDARLRALKWQQAGRVMTGLGVVSILGAGYYLYKSINHDEKPFGEIEEGVSISPTFFHSSIAFPETPNQIFTKPMVGFGLKWSF